MLHTVKGFCFHFSSIKRMYDINVQFKEKKRKYVFHEKFYFILYRGPESFNSLWKIQVRVLGPEDIPL